jgi:hypothetical protein
VAHHAHGIAHIGRAYDPALADHPNEMAQNLIQGFDLVRIAFQENLASASDDSSVELVAQNAEIGVVLSEEMEWREIAEVDATGRLLFRKLAQSDSFTGERLGVPGPGGFSMIVNFREGFQSPLAKICKHFPGRSYP